MSLIERKRAIATDTSSWHPEWNFIRYSQNPLLTCPLDGWSCLMEQAPPYNSEFWIHLSAIFHQAHKQRIATNKITQAVVTMIKIFSNRTTFQSEDNSICDNPPTSNWRGNTFKTFNPLASHTYVPKKSYWEKKRQKCSWIKHTYKQCFHSLKIQESFSIFCSKKGWQISFFFCPFLCPIIRVKPLLPD